MDQIRRRKTIHGALDAQQRQRLVEIADRWPVQHTLLASIEVATEATATDRDPDR